ncbi:M20 family metallopeptidase [Caldinitratiruptor microaerophilus]|uniref:Peptidase M20 n=1 Tax=Caldinitratiruptor microaerophilus TaxID=671077 RepID=A0AA35G6Z5_9FIRM|nr:M20 family metallopeptidase [Caldinitratiruptor microaerophilus]BDG59526.1 peptidase M20 [Caldinitratiruptor microaerophilus]
MDPVRLLRHLEQRTEAMLADLRVLVEHESPTGDEGALTALAGILAARWSALGAGVRRHPVPGVGPHLEIRWPGAPPAGPGDTPPRPALLLCHMDTVHPVGTLARNPFRVEQGRAYGPGSYDMKAGIVMALHAARSLQELGLAPARPVVLLVTTDEEVGSLTSRALIEARAREAAYALVLEPAAPGGAVKTARKGVARYDLTVQGKAAHAGNDFERGVSANVELARLILALHALSDLERGTTVNIGVVQGGTRANVVPEFARAEVDVRFFHLDEATRVDRAVRSLTTGPGASLRVEGGINRPPLERTAAVAEMYEHARALAAQMDYPLPEAAVGGASDGNFTAGTGLPTLDGLGAAGDGAHTTWEYVEVSSLAPRTALLAALLATL